MRPNSAFRQIIKRCQKSPLFFINNFLKVKHPKAGIIPFKTWTYQKANIVSFLKHRFVIYKKVRQCFEGSNRVWTPNGPCRIDEIKIGDKLYSLDIKTGQLVVVRVKKTFQNGLADCFEVRTKTGHRSIVTEDHEFLTRRGYVAVKNLTNEDVLIEVNDNQRYGKHVSKSEAALLGYLLTDGYCGKKQVHFTNTRWKYLLEFQKHFAKMFLDIPVLTKHSTSGFGTTNAFRVYSYSRTCRQWLQNLGILGLTKEKKFIPEEVFTWDNESIAIMINRMFASDGWYGGNEDSGNEIGIGQISITILHQLKQLLSRFGINSKIYEEANPIPKLRILGGPDFEKFVKNIGIFGKEPRKELTKGFIFNRIKGQVKSIKKIEGQKKVYDLNVPPHNNYIVDGVVVHNCGISTVSGAFALWYSMFYPYKTILIVSKRDDDAMNFLDRNIKFPYDNLPDEFKRIWGDPPPTYNEHSIRFPNQSQINSLTSSKETLRSHSASLNILDEVAFIPDMEAMWAAGLPTLSHGGSVICISCVPLGTYIFTNNGLQLIDDFVDRRKVGGYEVEKYAVLGRDNIRNGIYMYNSGISDTKRFTTRYGEIEGSLEHKLWAFKTGVGFGWYKMSQLEIGDWLSMQYNMNVWGNDDLVDFKPVGKVKYPFNTSIIIPDLAYFFGLYIAEGSVFKNKNCHSNTITITCGDDISDILIKLGLSWSRSKDGVHWYISATHLWDFMEYLGFERTTASKKIIPSRLLKCSVKVISALLSGMYDGDGHSRKRGGLIGYTTTSSTLAKQIRLLLNNFGIITTQRIRIADAANAYIKRKVGKKGKVSKHNYDTYIIECNQYYSSLFFENIGFKFNRKQENNALNLDTKEGMSWDVIPNGLQICREIFKQLPFGTWVLKKRYGVSLNQILSKKPKKNVSRKTILKLLSIANKNGIDVSSYHQNVDANIIWSKIEKIYFDKKDVYDFSLPDNQNDEWAHSIIYNGFIGHQTPNGVGDWYENTYTDAKDKKNQFFPIDINWWEMDWKITYTDDVTGEERTICPTDGIRKCTTEEDIEKWGPYWSPWLEEQYRMLQQKGEAHKFRQEILAEFIGSGQTVLKRKALMHVQSTVLKAPKFQTVGIVDYVHPVTTEALKLDFENEFKIWRMPVQPQPDIVEHGRIIRRGRPGHIYAVGLDVSTGEDSDLSGIEVIDCTLMEQVAELELRVMPNVLIMMADYIGRLFNYALIIPERTGLGAPICQDLYHVFGYANVFRMKMPSGKRSRKIGFPNSPTHKPTLNKAILDNIGEDGVTIYSECLYNQLLKYVHLGRNRTGALSGNHDDLVSSFGCALLGIQDSLLETPAGLFSSRDLINIPKLGGPTLNMMLQQGGMGALLPVRLMPSGLPGVLSPDQEIQKFIKQMGGGFVIGGGKPDGFGQQIIVR